jgi:multisubunit Na+/H+ antiporter MnhB subunit
MRRYDRSRFLAFGALPLANVAGLLIYGLALTTHGTGGAGRSLPALVVIAAVCLLIAMAAAIKRGRDVGWPVWLTAVAFWAALGMGPALLLLIGYFAFAKSPAKADELGPPATPPTAATWAWAISNLLWPWVVLAVLAKIL